MNTDPTPDDEPTREDYPLTEEQKRDLDRRIAADDRDPQPAEDWEVLKAKLLMDEF